MPSEEPTTKPTPAPTAAPKAGLSILGPATLKLAEDPRLAAFVRTFNVSLNAAPLSPVHVTFSSAKGHITLSPPVLLFDWTNYSTPAHVTAAAVDDWVDQAPVLYRDQVVVSVASDDSFPACKALRGRSACLQAVAYNGLAPPPGALNATILDDDAAGLAVSREALNATVDNYGDALSPGVYRVRLTSQPLRPVNVKVVGASAFTTLSPPTLVFEPAGWNASQVVELLAAAPTARRPVCPGGALACPDLAGRHESLSHVVNSSDPKYDVLAAGSAANPAVELRVSVVRDAGPPPRVTSSRLVNLLNGFEVVFDGGTDQAGLSGSFSCGAVLNLSASDETTLFGVGAACSWPDAQTLAVTFGSGNPTIVPGQPLRLRESTLRAQTPASGGPAPSLFSTNQSFALVGPSVPTVPAVVLSASSSVVGVCDDLTVDGSGTTGSGGRAMAFAWSVAGLNSAAPSANVSAAVSAANAAGVAQLAVPWNAMAPGQALQFTLSATNFLELSGSASVAVRKAGLPLPAVSVQGANPRETTHSLALDLVVSAALPQVACLGSSGGPPNGKMSFKWSEETGAFAGALSGTSKNPRTLRIPAGSLAASATYVFRAVAVLTDRPSLNNSATVSVVVTPQQVVAAIAGGSSRQVGSDAGFTLGSASQDPDEDSATPFAYQWACAPASAGANCSYVDGTMTSAAKALSTLAVPAGTLPVGTYAFTLFAAKAARNDTASCTVEVVAGAPPVVDIADPVIGTKPSASQGFMSVTANVSSALLISNTEWTMPGSDVAMPFQASGVAVASVANKLTCVVLLSSLTPKVTYTLQLSASDTAGAAAAATMTFTMNDAPSSGVISVEPTTGFALDTDFVLRALYWVDEDLPLSYVFGTCPVAAVASGYAADSSSLQPFGGARASALYSGATLSQGAAAVNSTVRPRALGRERTEALRLEASSDFSAPPHLLPSPPPKKKRKE